MINLNYIKDNFDAIKESIRKRGLKVSPEEILKEGEIRNELLTKIEQIRHELNSAPKQKPNEEELARLRESKVVLAALLKEFETAESNLSKNLKALPNLISPDTPKGGEDDFKEIKRWGDIPEIKNPKDHEELGKSLDLIDFDSAAKVSGAKFYYLKNEAVTLEFALIQYVMRILLEEGFTPMITPQIVKNEVLEGIGFSPKGPEKQVYGLDEDEMSLIGTAEITLGGYHKDEVLAAVRLPIKYAGFSTCFRTEAGAYGRHSKGLYRVHQFDKVEMFIYCLPEDSEKMHQYLVLLEEKIFQGLGIAYRVIEIAAGDLGAPAYRKFDIEAWMSGRGDYGEVTSTSNTTDYQSTRLNIKFEKDGQKRFVHTLNGTAIAISRALIAILENYQQKDGSVKIPDVLIPFTGFSEILPKN